MRNLYIETIEELFYCDIKPWDITMVTMEKDTGSKVELSWDEFVGFAKRINYTPNSEEIIIDPTLTILCTKNRKMIRGRLINEEAWRYIEMPDENIETVSSLLASSFVRSCNAKYVKITEGSDIA